jgi:hypothetical protein
MKRFAIICAALLGAVSSAHATPHKAPVRTAHVSSCIARQRAALAPLDQYGGHLPTMAPALMQEIMNPLIDRMRVHCLPPGKTPPDYAWDAATGTDELQ